MRIPSTRIRQIRERIRIFFYLLSRTEKDKFATNPDIFEFDDVSKLCPVLYRAINKNGGTTCRPNFAKVNPDTTGCVWTGKFLDPEKSLNLLVSFFFCIILNKQAE